MALCKNPNCGRGDLPPKEFVRAASTRTGLCNSCFSEKYPQRHAACFLCGRYMRTRRKEGSDARPQHRDCAKAALWSGTVRGMKGARRVKPPKGRVTF